ncbi:MAG: hypothetical protein IJH78_00170 [Clostridia bacterium]|nr:hypothetical protein [Clostridia bacterium]
MKQIKAHCAKHDKWFVLQEEDGAVVNFVNITREQSRQISTQTEETSHPVSVKLRPCQVCASRRAGRCSHIEALGRCDAEYSYQCLFCENLKINRGQAVSRFTDWAGTNLIPGAETDQYGNAKGSQYDLAKDGGFAGFRIVILCLYTGEGILDGIRQPIAAMEKKGFTVDLRSDASPQELERLLTGACQLWVISDRVRHLNDRHLKIIREFYEAGHGLYIFGDNQPFYEDANFLAKHILGTTMHGNTMGDKVIGVSQDGQTPGIIAGHVISTGLVNLYEGITIATVRTSRTVRSLVTSSARQCVTAIVEEKGRRALLDGGFTRLFIKWDTAGTDRFIVNAAAWLANAEVMDGGGEVSFT